MVFQMSHSKGDTLSITQTILEKKELLSISFYDAHTSSAQKFSRIEDEYRATSCMNPDTEYRANRIQQCIQHTFQSNTIYLGNAIVVQTEKLFT